MDPAARLLRLLSLLQARPSWPAGELADRLGVGTRTIRRDIVRLRDLGYPVHTNPGIAGYQLGAGGRLPPLLLDDDEAAAIALGLRLAANAAVSGVEGSVVAALAKLDQVLPHHIRERVHALEAAMVQFQGPPGNPVAAQVLIELTTASRRLERVRFAYRDYAGAVTDRRVEPFQIVHTGRRWYLVARDVDRDDWRTFRVDRISEAAMTGHRFVRHDPPDAVARVREGTKVTAFPVEARILLELPVHVARRRFEADGIVEPAGDGRSLLRVAANHVADLARFAASLPCAFEVVAPPELRAELRRLGRTLAAQHRDVAGKGTLP